MKNKTLLLFCKSIDGGTGTYILNLLRLNEFSPDYQYAIAPLVLEKPSYRKIEREDFIFAHASYYYPHYYSLSFKYVLSFISELVWMYRQYRRINPDLILSVDIHCNLLVLFLKITRLIKVKVIATTHIQLSNTLKDKSSPFIHILLTTITKKMYQKADAHVAVSKALKKHLQQVYKLTGVFTIYNGVALNKNNTISQTNTSDTFITVNRLVEQKDHVTLIQAFAFLLKKVPTARLWILSDGPLKESLRKRVVDLGIERSVTFFGWVPDVAAYIRQADIFVLSSRREGFSYVLIEAMSQGKPIIATDTPVGPAEILDNGTYGFLVKMGDVTEMKKAMLKLITSKRIFQKYAALALKRSNDFSVDHMLLQYSSLINKMMS